MKHMVGISGICLFGPSRVWFLQCGLGGGGGIVSEANLRVRGGTLLDPKHSG